MKYHEAFLWSYYKHVKAILAYQYTQTPK